MNFSSNTSTTDTSCDSSCWEEAITEINASMVISNLPILIFMCAVMVTGIPGNLLVIIVYGVRKTRAKTTTLFMITLACVDLSTCVVLHPYIIAKMFNIYNQHQGLVCKLFEFFIHSTLSVSVSVLLLVAVDRYLAICRPFLFIKYQTRSTMILIITFICGILISLPLLEFYGRRTVHIPGSVLNGYICDFSDAYQGLPLVSYFGLALFVMFFLILSTMIFLYLQVAHIAFQRRMRAVFPTELLQSSTLSSKSCQSHSNLNSQNGNKVLPVHAHLTIPDVTSVSKQVGTYQPKPTVSASTSGTHHTNESNRNASNTDTTKFKAAKVLFSVTAFFILSWLPFWIIRLCWAFAPTIMANTSDTWKEVERFINFLVYANNSANPIIYTIINSKFRKECRIFVAKFRRDVGEMLVPRRL